MYKLFQLAPIQRFLHRCGIKWAFWNIRYSPRYTLILIILYCFPESMMVTYLICHILGMTTSCTNPFLYGFLNDNFFKEFQKVCPVYWGKCQKKKIIQVLKYRHFPIHFIGCFQNGIQTDNVSKDNILMVSYNHSLCSSNQFIETFV